MDRIKRGDIVRVTYEGLLADGEIFESSRNSGPLEFEIGGNSVMPAFERAILEMRVGEEKSVTLQPEEAHGPRQEELIVSFPRSAFGEHVDPQPGMVLGMNIEQEGKPRKIPATVSEVTKDTVVMDFNHPLAGQPLTYKITLLAVNRRDRE